MQFNLSHSDDRVTYAISADRALGVDIERVRPLDDMETIARRFFSGGERQTLMSLNTGDRLTAFYRCWTRKEAYLKGLGDGLARPLSEFDVSVLPDAQPLLLRPATTPAERGRWTLSDIDVGPGYVGAIAVDGPRPEIRRWSWRRGTGAGASPSTTLSTPRW